MGQSDRSQSATLRILDAAANRATEGMRVVEDFVRFAMDDSHLTEQCKQIRHEIAQQLAKIPFSQRTACRETLQDVGTTATTKTEMTRADCRQVAQVNSKRVIESLRSLEEYSKISHQELSSQLEKIRYRFYTLERAIFIALESQRRLESVRLYVLVDGDHNESLFQQRIERLVTAGVEAIQLRDKTLEDRKLIGRARLLRKLTKNRPCLFIMNDRPDLAVLCDADGVHVGQSELSVKDVRTILGPNKIIGVSTHGIDQAKEAVLDGANYIGVGPTFASATKSFSDFTGIELLNQVASEIRLPAFAIGGIDLENLSEVLDSGISRIAVSGALKNLDQITPTTQGMLKLLDEKDRKSKQETIR